MLSDFDKLCLGADVETNKDKIGLAVYHLDIERGLEPSPEDIKKVLRDSRININPNQIYPYLSQLEGTYLKKSSGSYKLMPDGIQHYRSKISEEEKKFKYGNSLITVDDISGQFYPALVSSINDSYSAELYNASLILSRKLLENLLIDILRSRFGPQELELYYDQNRKQFLGFSKLIENFESKASDLEHYYTVSTERIIQILEDFREVANASTHSIEIIRSEEEIDDWAEDLEFLVRFLFEIKAKV